jgi:Uma2 family endonuclease
MTPVATSPAGCYIRIMSFALNLPSMTRDAFFTWAEGQEGRYEFDGFQPLAMTGGTANHSLVVNAIHRALYDRLKNSPCRALGPDAGLSTIGDAVRYPDAMVTCSTFAGSARLIPGVVAVFEVLSPSSGRTDRIEKLREYQAVQTILRYVILEHQSAAAIIFERARGDEAWTAVPLTADDTLRIPSLGLEIPVAEFYVDAVFGAAEIG